jgi:hypothetical protein
MNLLSNSLTVLAARVKEALGDSAIAEKSAIEKALEAGSMLCEAKASCDHGDWLPFLESAGVPERKAQRYMRLARSGLKSDTVSDLGGIKAALRWLERLHLPGVDEYLMVSLDGFSPDRKERLAIMWQDGGGHRFTIFNLDPCDSWADTLTKPIIKTEYLWPALFSLFENRCREMYFCIVPKDTKVDMATWPT